MGKTTYQKKPLIFAIQSFEHLGQTNFPLLTYLYGIKHTHFKDSEGNITIISEHIDKHNYNGAFTKSGFFLLPDSENISAVLFSNSATISKFNRMGKLAGFGSPRVNLIRMGLCINHDPKATQPSYFYVDVNPKTYEESWGQGISIFHNPNALKRIDPSLFPNAAHHFYENGQIRTVSMEKFIPLNSETMVLLKP